ncbi:MAG: hypothetical protein ACLP50_03825, partial [Solirubrobacteraceae bacterium]
MPNERAKSPFTSRIDLFTPIERRRGLPLGNQTSQFFANGYLDPLPRGGAFLRSRAGFSRSEWGATGKLLVNERLSHRSGAIAPVPRIPRVFRTLFLPNRAEFF